MAISQYDLIVPQNLSTGIEFTEQTINISKGVLISGNASRYPTVLLAGSNGDVLMLDSTTETGLKWTTPSTFSDTNTTYILDGSGTTNNVNLELISSSGTTDRINIVGSGGTTVSWDEGNQRMTINSTDTNTYSISTESSTQGVNAIIRLTASLGGTDDVTIATSSTDGVTGLTITEAGDTITINHANTSTISGQQGSNGISSVTVDALGHVTAVGTATYLTTQNSSKNIIGSGSTSTTNAAVPASTNLVYLNHLENSTVTSYHSISGSGGTAVSTDANGNITISSPSLSLNDAMMFVGTVNGNGTIHNVNTSVVLQAITPDVTPFSGLTAYQAGWTWKVITDGNVVGKNVSINDMIISIGDFKASFSSDDWNVIQGELDNVVTSALAGTVNYVALYDSTARSIKPVQRIGLAQFPTISGYTILGNNTGSAAEPIAMTVNQTMTMLWQSAPSTYNADASSVGLIAKDVNFNYLYISRVAGTGGSGRWGRIPIAAIWSNT